LVVRASRFVRILGSLRRRSDWPLCPGGSEGGLSCLLSLCAEAAADAWDEDVEAEEDDR
jgi:hypothetical protein